MTNDNCFGMHIYHLIVLIVDFFYAECWLQKPLTYPCPKIMLYKNYTNLQDVIWLVLPWHDSNDVMVSFITNMMVMVTFSAVIILSQSHMFVKDFVSGFS